jgi:hypothetical protein
MFAVVQSNLNGSYDLLEEDIKQLERQKVLFLASHDPDSYGLGPSGSLRDRLPLVGEKRGHGAMAACDSMYVAPSFPPSATSFTWRVPISVCTTIAHAL